MNDNQTIWKLVSVAIVGFAIYMGTSGKIPLPWDKVPGSQPETGAPNMETVFNEGDDREKSRNHALVAAELFGGLARSIDYDGTLEEQKQLKTTGAAEDVRNLARHYFTRGWSFDKDYPKFGDTVGTFLDQKCGTDAARSLDANERAKWKEAYLVLEKECRRVSGLR
jgi:hypothetical protein